MNNNIVIIGSGPVGLLAAIYLHSHGLSVTLIGPEPLPAKNMVFALHPEHVSLLHDHQIKISSKTVTKMQLQLCQHHITLSAQMSAYQSLCQIVSHTELLTKLKTTLRNLQIPWVKAYPSAISPSAVRVNHHEITADHILACDGTQSWTRAQTPITCQEYPYQQFAHTALVTHTRKVDYAFQRFSSDGTLALLPTNNAHQSALILSSRIPLHQEIKDKGLKPILTSLNHIGKLIETKHHRCVELTARHANTYHYGRIYLLGNACHTIHPLAGIGFNLAVSDIKDACQNLCNQLPPAHYTLKRRRSHQKAHWLTHSIASMEDVNSLGPVLNLAEKAISTHYIQKKIFEQIDQICLG